MSEIEKECRYEVNDTIVNNIKKICKIVNEKKEQIDLTLGYDGFESLYKYGYVCRVRKKGSMIWMEIKNRKDNETFDETKIIIDNFNDGIRFFKALGMRPYMYMKRTREILEYGKLKIFIDDIEMLGKFVEIEFQDATNYEETLLEFVNLVEIESEKKPLYGDIIKQKIASDNDFKNKYENRLNEFLKYVD